MPSRKRSGQIEHSRTRPQTNGKVERFHRTLADEWAYARLYTSDTNAAPSMPGGYRTTITTAATTHSAANHPPPAYLTSQAVHLVGGIGAAARCTRCIGGGPAAQRSRIVSAKSLSAASVRAPIFPLDR